MENQNTPSLGDMLRQKITADDTAKQRAEAEAERQRQEKEAADNACIQHFYDDARQTFTEQIMAGKRVTPIRVESYRHNPRVADLLKLYKKSPANPGNANPRSSDHDPYYPFWVEFRDWAAQNGLEAKWVSEHDGMGVNSWYLLTVEPTPKS